MRITFVILHYLTEQDTIECINSIVNNVRYQHYNILVVDNGSPNGSGESLKIRYRDNNKVKVIISDFNLGFAKGNNIGFYKAKYENKSDFIVLMNNDTVVEQQDFLEQVVSLFKVNKYAVLGPNIISTVDKKHQNPQPIRIRSIKDALYQFIRHFVLLSLNYLKLESLIKKILGNYKKVNIHVTRHDQELMNVQLHGSCLIFSPLYIQKFDGLYDKTFMYFEEDILFHLCRKHRLKTMYSPDLTLFHKEDSATNEYLKNSSQKNRFIYRHTLKSIIQLIKIIK
ncbi:glycosyltransferase [Metabacillus niabensis]|uniref:glycosyltransferase n=1 Tax=Metabacillus niabensis TaxID=324854 RepID=UPI001CFC233A|nr:glycosyltransferase family 2 protein [Metabacillus niabensis]